MPSLGRHECQPRPPLPIGTLNMPCQSSNWASCFQNTAPTITNPCFVCFGPRVPKPRSSRRPSRRSSPDPPSIVHSNIPRSNTKFLLPHVLITHNGIEAGSSSLYLRQRSHHAGDPDASRRAPFQDPPIRCKSTGPTQNLCPPQRAHNRMLPSAQKHDQHVKHPIPIYSGP